MGFLGSREFVVGSVVGLLLAGGFLAVPSLFPDLVAAATSPCPTPDGTSVPADTDDQDGALRTLAFQQEPGTALRLCIDVGNIHVEVHDGSDVRFDVQVRSTGSGAAERVAETAFVLTRDGDALHLAQTRNARTTWWFGGQGAEVDVTVLVPADAPTAYDVTVDVGAVTADGLHGAGTQRWTVDVGEARVAYDRLDNATVHVGVDVGDAVLEVPEGPGYHADLSTDVGLVVQGLPDMHLLDKDDDPAGDRVVAQSIHRDEAAVRVDIVVRVDVGDVRLLPAGDEPA